MDVRDYQSYIRLDRQVRDLELAQQRRSGQVQDSDAYAFTLSATCPPSTSIMFRGGLAWFPDYSLYPAGFHIPTYRVDLSDYAKTNANFKFINPGWYRACFIGIDQNLWPPPNPWPDTVPDDAIYFYNATSTTEYETAAEAEIGVRELVGDWVSYYSIAAGGIVLRNNGNVAEYNQFLPIDPINRGGSYLFDNRKRYGWQLG